MFFDQLDITPLQSPIHRRKIYSIQALYTRFTELCRYQCFAGGEGRVRGAGVRQRLAGRDFPTNSKHSRILKIASQLAAGILPFSAHLAKIAPRSPFVHIVSTNSHRPGP